MIQKSSNFFEEHVEKIILILAVLLCFWILVTRIFLSPNEVLYDKKKLSADEIDNYIMKDIKLLELKLEDEPNKHGAVYESKRDDFIALIESAIDDINSNVYLPQPVPGKEVIERKLYHLPEVGQVDAVAVEHIRAVAYFPVGEIEEENTDNTVEHEPNDLDLVTVEAKFDVKGLRERFNESFAGEDLKEEWRDSSLAKPVFAAVQLQRQEQLADGSWGDWQDVPRIKNNGQGGLFEIIERVEDLPAGGVRIRQLHFDNNLLQRELLQPKAYFIASLNEQWFPPLLHRELVEKVKEIKTQKVREAKAAAEEFREQERRKAREKMAAEKTVPTVPSGGASGRFGGLTTVPKPRREASAREPERTITVPEVLEEKIFSEIEKEIYSDFKKILITEQTSFSDINEPLTFWAHDDTVEPKKTYRYRIKIGVFNPVAGTDDISEEDKSRKRDVTLWSKFSEVTEEVTIPGNLYFFPNRIKEASKSVTVQVSKYVLGYWYSKNFTVAPGETIGRVAGTDVGSTSDVGLTANEKFVIPEEVDYSTDIIMVDAVLVNDWVAGRMSPEFYYDMFFSFDGENIERIACEEAFWPKRLQEKYYEIKKLQKEPRTALRAWSPQEVLPEEKIEDQGI